MLYGDALMEAIIDEIQDATPEELAASLKEYRRQLDSWRFFVHVSGG